MPYPCAVDCDGLVPQANGSGVVSNTLQNNARKWDPHAGTTTHFWKGTSRILKQL